MNVGIKLDLGGAIGAGQHPRFFYLGLGQFFLKGRTQIEFRQRAACCTGSVDWAFLPAMVTNQSALARIEAEIRAAIVAREPVLCDLNLNHARPENLYFLAAPQYPFPTELKGLTPALIAEKTSMRFVIFMLATFAAPVFAQDAIYRFEWVGGGGYRMVGAMSFNPAAASGLVTQDDVSCFEIQGFLEEEPVGRWDLSKRGLGTAWRLHFRPEAERFLVVGDGFPMPQAWNMRGDGLGCGEGGFGFNLGNVAQDLCIDETLIKESQADPYQPFPAVRVDAHSFGSGACRAPVLLGMN